MNQMMALIFALIPTAIMLGTAPAAAAPVELKFALFSPSGIIGKGVIEPWAKWVHDQVGNEIKIKMYPGGILGPDPVQQLKLLKDGVQDITFAVPSYTPARFPVLSVVQLPGLVRNSREGSKAIWRMYERGMITGFEDVKLLGLFTLDVYNLHMAKPIRSYRNVKGLKLRTGGRIQNDIARALGAVPVGKPVTQIAENISRGVLDGAITPWTSLIPFRIIQVTKYHYNAHLGMTTLVFAMNKGQYEKLSPKAKSVMDRSGPLLSRLQGNTFDGTRQKYIKQYQADSKHTVLDPTPAEQREMESLFKPMHQQWKAKYGAKRYDTLVSILAEIQKGN